MKRKTTKEILAESFREVAETRPVDKITIQEIVDNCNDSPATFYRHFKDKYDLIAWDYVNRSNEIMDKVGINDSSGSGIIANGVPTYMLPKEWYKDTVTVKNYACADETPNTQRPNDRKAFRR